MKSIEQIKKTEAETLATFQESHPQYFSHLNYEEFERYTNFAASRKFLS